MERLMKLMIPMLCLVLAAVQPQPGMADQQARGLEYVETADGNRSAHTRNLIQWTHARLQFSRDLKRVAVGQNEIMEVEILGGREVLVLAKKIGRTSVIAWYPDDSTETFLFSVVEDHSLLRRALYDIDPGIRLDLAPDRNALVLRGTVPTIKQRAAAESAALNYLNAGTTGAGAGTLLVQDPADGDRAIRVGQADEAVPVAGAAAVINLLKVRELPSTVAEKITTAIAGIGGSDVSVRRVVHGDIENDASDTLILEGTVHNQVALVRILNVASRLFLGDATETQDVRDIKAIADESGALLENRRNSGSSGLSGSGLSSSGLPFGSGQRWLENEVRANIGRAKLISIADGRILSMIEVRDLPQVRVSVQIHEINRQRMKSWRPDLSLVSDGYQPLTNGDGLGVTTSPGDMGQVDETQIEGAMQILGGTLSSHLQVGTSELAFDLLFSLMEQEGISRTLSRPTLTVLAGEDAVFQVGGEVPVPSAFAPTGVGASNAETGGTVAPGVFSGTEFRAFGVQLMIRPMVGEDDRITLDVQPTVSLPDVGLTALIAGSTGTPLNTTAFNTRSIDTTTRLRDGQPLVIGGLVSRDISDSKTFTPTLHNVPGVGWLAKNSDRSDSDRELVIVVTPTIVREPQGSVALWQFPEPYELMADSIGMLRPDRRAPATAEDEESQP